LNEKILLVEGNRSDHPSFRDGLIKRGYLVVTVPNGNSALKRICEIDPDLVVVDAASLRTSGKRICRDLRQSTEDIPIILIVASNGENSEKKDPINKLEKEVVLTLPFTLQKLINRIKPLLPVEGRQVINEGPIRLDIEHKKVRCMNQSGKLTPHLVRLLQILMEHPGEVVEREVLFRDVWETEYTGDTRTLDVHISWLRRIIEVDPRHPRFIKTVRGFGYRLDV
jgi:DNA-binding response OmpR family regulator